VSDSPPSDQPDFPTTGRIAGIDYGTKRIGVAITDPDRRLASPLANYDRGSPEQDAAYFRRLVADEQIVAFVVGLPIHLSGQESRKSREARAFGDWLEETTGRPVCYFDERFTTREAHSILAASGSTRKQTRKRLDMLAAQRLLADFLESGGKAHRWSPDSL